MDCVGRGGARLRPGRWLKISRARARFDNNAFRHTPHATPHVIPSLVGGEAQLKSQSTWTRSCPTSPCAASPTYSDWPCGGAAASALCRRTSRHSVIRRARACLNSLPNARLAQTQTLSVLQRRLDRRALPSPGRLSATRHLCDDHDQSQCISSDSHQRQRLLVRASHMLRGEEERSRGAVGRLEACGGWRRLGWQGLGRGHIVAPSTQAGSVDDPGLRLRPSPSR